MNSAETILEFNIIKEKLCAHAVSDAAKRKLAALSPFADERICQAAMEETTQARRIIDNVGSPPLSFTEEIAKLLILCEKGSMLSPEQIESVSMFISCCRRMIGYLKKTEALHTQLDGYGRSMHELTDLQAQLDQAVQNAVVISSASAALKDLRRKIENESAQIKKVLADLLRSKKKMFADGFVTQRNGRYVVPVKKEYKNQIAGSVVDISGTGGAYFIEPAAVSKAQDKMNALKLEEDGEIRRILYALTALIDRRAPEIRVNIDALTTLDFIFAKAKLSAELDAVPVAVRADRAIRFAKGRHPLLEKSKCVPLDFSIGTTERGIVITGPNTGGKTVALKTVGLLSMMAQSGLHVPVESGEFAVNSLILADIGDGQSISENLSTFSSHIVSVVDILRAADQGALVLLDELGSGTDPAEGMGLAIAILEELRTRGCLFVATTHYPEVKQYAARAEGLANARMAFDKESLNPLYRLEIGAAGESCALYIAKRLGFPARMLERARRETYGKNARGVSRDCDFPLPALKTAPPKISPARENQKSAPPNIAGGGRRKFQLGDSVSVLPKQQIGVVFRAEDAKGNVGAQVKGEQFFVNRKRLRLMVPAAELYPPDYDFSILFDSVDNRKARRKMEKRHMPGLVVEIEKPRS